MAGKIWEEDMLVLKVRSGEQEMEFVVRGEGSMRDEKSAFSRGIERYEG